MFNSHLINRLFQIVHWLHRVLKVTHLVWDAVEGSLSLEGANQNDHDVQKPKDSSSCASFCPVLLVFLVTFQEISAPDVHLVAKDDQNSHKNHHYIVHYLPSGDHLAQDVYLGEEARITLSHFQRGIRYELGVIIRLHDWEQLLVERILDSVLLLYVIRIHEVIVHVEVS